MPLFNIDTDLLPYQRTGVEFLTDSSRKYKMLADDMGLGKTIQAIAAAVVLKSPRVLVICPSSVKLNWQREIYEWADHVYKDTSILNGYKNKTVGKPQVLCVNYELMLCKHNRQALREFVNKDTLVILDEAHYLKNKNSKRTRHLLGRFSPIRIADRIFCLTGTPVLAKPVEIYNLVSVMAPDLIADYPSYVAFTLRYCDGKEGNYGWEADGATNIKELRDKLNPFMLRRLKEDVLEDLPDITHKYLPLATKYENDDDPLPTVRRLLGEHKVPYVVGLLKDLVYVKKVVVFAQHTAVIAELTDKLSEYGVVVVKGGLDYKEKQRAIDTFVNDTNVTFFIGQIQASGTGIDGLQKVCSTVVFAEFDWTPGVMDQCIDRCRRIGQHNNVLVIYPHIPGSLEDSIIGGLRRKRSVVKELLPISVNIKEPKMTIEAKLDTLIELQGDTNLLLQQLVSGLNEEPEAEAVEPKAAAKTKAKEPKAETKKKEAEALTHETARAFAAAIGDKFPPGSAQRKEVILAIRAIVNSNGGEDKIDTLPETVLTTAYAELKGLAARVEAGEFDALEEEGI